MFVSPIKDALFQYNQNPLLAYGNQLEIQGHLGFWDQCEQVDWKNIAGMRDKLIHQYFGVNWNILWDVIKEKLPGVKVHLEKILDRK